MTTLIRRVAESYPTAPYPGEIPPGAFMIRHGKVHLVSIAGSTGKALDGLALDAMVPLLTYGSNACPGRLFEKFVTTGAQNELDGILVLPAHLHGAQTAWACKINSRNAVPRTLVAGGSVPKAHVLLLPRELVPRMDASEGRGRYFYDAVELTDATAEIENGGQWRSPVTYLGVGHRGPLVVDSAVFTCDETTEADARQQILDGRAACSDDALPPHRVIPAATSLWEHPHPTVAELLG